MPVKVWVIRMLEKILDLKGTFEGKFLAVLLSVVMALSLTNLSAFAVGGTVASTGNSSTAASTTDAQMAQSAVDHGTQSAATDEGATIGSIGSDEAKVTFKADDAYVTVNGQVLSGTTLTTVLHKELAFSAAADSGYRIDSITAANAANAVVPVTTQNGTTTIAAEYVDSTLVVTVSAVVDEAQKAQAPETKPITDSAASDATSSTATTQEQTASSDATASPAFEGYAYVGTTVVKVTAPQNVLPAGATVKAVQVDRSDVIDAVAATVENQGKTLESSLAIDVTLYDKAGNEIQPSGQVNVTFFNGNIEGEQVGVFHVSDDATSVQTVSTLQADSDVQSFQTDHFSIYVVTATATSGPKQGSYSVSGNGTVVISGTETWYSSSWDDSWKSGNKSIASVAENDNGYEATVTGVSAGTTTITHTYTKNTGRSTTETFTVTVTPSAYTVTFNKNGGSAAAPAAVSGQLDSTIVLPSYSGTRSGYTFAGWSTASNVVSSTYYAIYPAGSEYQIKSSVTLYAVWTQSANATFYIRTDGTIPYEPSQYSASSYTGGITIANALKANRWVCDTTGVAVLANLNSTPTDTQIKNVLPTYNANSQYVVWYVIKAVDNGSWHVDGVVLSKNKINLTYEGNGNGDVSNVPLGSQFYNGTTVKVGHSGGNDQPLLTPTRPGYTFSGWNTAADGTGTAYANDSTFVINAPTTLYAQWVPNDKTSYKVERYLVDGATTTLLTTRTDYGVTGNTASVKTSDKTYSGYTYLGDSYTGTVLSGTIAGDGSLVLKLFFSANKDVSYTVNYYKQGTTTSVAPSKVVTGQTYGSTITENAIDVTNYDKVAPTSATIKLDSYGQEITFYYTAKNVTLTFNAIDGTKIVDKTGTYGDTFTAGTTQAIDLASAKLLAKNGTSGVAASAIDACTSLDDLAALGFTYAFSGWGTASNNGGAVVVGGTDMAGLGVHYFAATFGDVPMFGGTTADVYARYVVSYAAKTSTIHFDANGGDQATAPADLSGTTGKSITASFPTTQPTRTGYTFTGWNTAVDGSGSAVTAYPGTFPVGTTTYYAQWKQNIKLTLTADSSNVMYDGTVHAVSTYTGLPSGATFPGGQLDEIVVAGSGTNAGTYAVSFTGHPAQLTDSNGNVYDVTYEAGSLTIDPASVELTANNATKPYDGTPLTESGYTISAGTFFGSDGLASVTMDGSRTDVGSSDNAISGYTLNASTNPANYKITEKKGTLTVTANETLITIQAGTASKTYEGTALTDGSATVTDLPAGFHADVQMTAASSIVDAGSISNVIGSYRILVDGTGQDVTSYFTKVEKKDGTLTVNPVALTITAASESKAYDGTPLVNSTYSLTSGAFVGTDAFASVVVTGSQTMVGQSDNVITSYAFAAGTKASNYTVTEVKGTLAVTNDNPIALTVTAPTDAKTYDGTPLSASTATVTAGKLAAGDEIVATVEGAQTDAGTSVNVITALVIVHDNGDGTTTDVTANYTLTQQNGTLTVNPRAITIKADSASRAYDGTPLTKPTYTTVSGSFVSGEGFGTVTVSGSQLYAGSSDNRITAYTFAYGTKTGNYAITTQTGTLTVTKASLALTITANSASKTYDGTELKDVGYTVTAGSLTVGDVLESASIAGSQTDAGSSANVASAAKIVHSGIDVTENYVLSYTPGTLTVNKKAVTLTSATATKAYDGTALTAHDGTTQTGFVDGQGVAFVVTGSQTAVGSSSNSFTYEASGLTNLENYTITEQPGTLTVTKNVTAVVLTAPSADKTYDGVALTKTDGVTATGLPEGFTVEAVVNGSQTDAGTSSNTIASYVIHDGDGKDVTASFSNVTLAAGELKVIPAPLTVFTPSDSKQYDGTALTAAGTLSGLVNNESVAFSTTGTQTAVGSSTNTYSIAWTGTAKESNYTVAATLGTLEVTKNTATITLQAPSDTKTYDGAPLTKPTGVEATGLPSGFTVDAVVSGTQTNVGSSVNALGSYKILDSKGDDVTSSFTVIKAVNGTLTVTPAPLAVTTPNASKQYDGTALTAAGTLSGLVDGETATFATTGTQTLIGSSTNTYTIAWNGTAQQSNYAITEDLGTLTVTNDHPIALSIAADSATKTYDGTKLTKKSATIQGTLGTGDTLSYDVIGSQTDAGSSANTVINVKVAHDNGDGTKTDVTAAYNVVAVDGALTVNPVAIELTANSATKQYDGMPLTDSGYSISSGAFVGSDGLATVSVSGAQTDVGFSANTITGHEFKGVTKPANYTVTYKPGTLEVTRSTAAVVVTAPSASKIYDGTPLTNSSVTATGLPAGFTVSASMTAGSTITNAGTTPNVIASYAIKDANGADVTSSFAKVSTVDGTLAVTPVALQITANSATKPYDGTALTDAGWRLTSGKFVGTEGFASVAVEGSQTLVGTSANEITGYAFASGTTEGNYTVTTVDGTLSVTNENPIAIEVTAASDDKPYDGTALTASSYTLTSGVLAQGDSLTAAVAGSQTDAGSSANVLSGVKIMHANGDGTTSDVTANYAVTPINGSLTVSPIAIEVAANSATKAYDGTPLTDSGWSVTSGSFVSGQGFDTVTVSGSQTFVGASANTVTGHALTAATKALNYTITYKPGTLTVTQASIALTITANSATKTYDGTALGASGYTQTAGTLASGDVVSTVALNGSQLDAGSSASTASNAVILHDVTDVTANYKITYIDGTLTVNPATLTVTTQSASKVYDGTALTAAGSMVGLVHGETAAYSTTGTQTLAGSSTNTYAIAWTGTAKAANYTVSESLGTLTVSQRAVSLTGESGTRTYNGSEIDLTNIDASNLAAGDVFEATASAHGMLPGTYPGTITSAANVVIKNAHDDDVTASYSVSTQPGTLTVTKIEAPITLSAASDGKVYDGTALTNGGFSFTPGVLLEGDTLSAMVEGSATHVTDAGVNAVTSYSVMRGAVDVTSAYTFADSKNGKLTITPQTITIKPNDNGKSYGDPEPTFDATVTGMVGAETFTGSYDVVRDPGEDAGTYVMSIQNATFANTDYKIVTQPGTFTIVPKEAAALLVADASKTYDGQALVPNGFTPIGLKAGDHAEVVYSGSQTNVGQSQGTIASYVIRDADGRDVTANYSTILVQPGTLTVAPKEAVITVNDASKVQGSTDPTFTGTVTGLVNGTDLGTIAYARTGSDEGVGTFPNVLTATFTANPNYTVRVVPGTFTITAPVPVPPPDNPLTPLVTPVIETLQGAVEAVIGDNPTPLAQEPREAEIGENETPLANQVWCWVHWYIILGIIVTLVYSASVALHRGLFSRKLKKYEDGITGGGDPDPGDEAAGVGSPSAPRAPKGAGAAAAVASGMGE